MVGSSFELEDLPDHLKIERNEWSAGFNPDVPRTLDLELKHELILGIPWVFCVRFSPDATLLAAGIGGGVQIFNVDDGQKFCELKHASGEQGWDDIVRAICFSADGKTLAAAGDDGNIRLWDIGNRKVLRTMAGHHAAITCLDLSADSKLLVSGSQDETVRLWDFESTQEISQCNLGRCINSVSIPPDSKAICVGTMSGAVLLDGSTFTLLGEVGGDDAHDDMVQSVAFSRSGEKLATASLDKTVRLWSMVTPGSQGSLIHSLEGHEDMALSVCWAHNDRLVITGSKDRSLLVSDTKSGKTQAFIFAHKNSILSIASTPQKRLFATAGADMGRVLVWSYSLREEPDSAAVSKTDDDSSSAQNALKRPGFGLPIHFLPRSAKRFPVLMGDEDRDWTAATLHVREVCMLKMIDELTDKPEWWLKAQDPEITSRWAREAMTIDWSAYRQRGDFTNAMTDACMIEIQKKAELYEKTGLAPVFDYSACVIKSDSISSDLFDALRQAVTSLENVPDDQIDWHPGSDGKVLDLVHPSLWPLIYGRTRILTQNTININNCIDYIGTGDIVSKPTGSDLTTKSHWPASGGDSLSIPSLSLNFQWLPCDVVIDEDGHAKIDSYINNLHPVEHAEMYNVINGFIEHSLPAWDIIYRWPKDFVFQRLRSDHVGPNCTTPDICRGDAPEDGWYECSPWNRPLHDGEPEREEDEPDTEGYKDSTRGKLDHDWYEKTHPVEPVDANTQENPKADQTFHLESDQVKTSGFFNGSSRIQVIAKLANIHLTPENPSYDGGSWHIEGQLNEHICATALFYYDNENITDSRLAFRTKSNRENLAGSLGYTQNDYTSIARTFAIDPIPGQDSTIQDIGSVLTRSGRAVFFPNLYQHRVQPFSLADPSRSGHRKILALFLVDPAIPIISTANVPPQQPHWKAGLQTDNDPAPGNTASEVIDLAEAKIIREALMSERSALQSQTNEKFEEPTFNFCEH